VQDDVLILLIGDAESSLQPRGLREFAQQRETERVDRPPADIVAQARRDLLGGAVREGDSADAVRLEPLIDEMLDSLDEAERFAGAGPGDDQHRAEWRFDGAPLLREGDQLHAPL
jgi:hypothetical protein